MEFREDQIERYSRHIILKEVGGSGQKKLLQSKVLIIGAGGLGSPVALYLAAAGVGTLALADMDNVDLSNLQRQILHSTKTVGKPKVLSAHETLTAMNPDVRVVPIQERLTAENVTSLFQDYDVIVDGSDNFGTRYVVNDAAFFLKKPLVSGSILRFEGQVVVLEGYRSTPCYRCLYPEAPPPGLVPSCSEAGVLGVLGGTIGTLQAVEVIKIILGLGDVLNDRLLIYDALSMSFRKVRVPKDPNCPLCGKNPSIRTVSGSTDWACSI
ncbi:Sulfur carrier protein adenylyltransferase ThiF [Leptospirillum ferriphilum]|jgi:adenylyltransferase/sulfurtransferase|uniref:Molybdopterin-synthase adenylyltransferase n=2 Tax=Leptospirillum TaxID=179 RepID=A0A094X7H9_9BACT|nr:molybdopterin-synthase adenylyltransferase MoeB [Leptospirillum ferriphilum]EDZ38577.1 MAG: Putative molybdopterin biosynthesis protein [Leptospirillum sp. Group II '5-way CG']KGA94469.1 Sulfur carrier protein adenylyltransferase ThiF [Leptospirillum ferriphilum]